MWLSQTYLMLLKNLLIILSPYSLVGFVLYLQSHLSSALLCKYARDTFLGLPSLLQLLVETMSCIFMSTISSGLSVMARTLFFHYSGHSLYIQCWIHSSDIHWHQTHVFCAVTSWPNCPYLLLQPLVSRSESNWFITERKYTVGISTIIWTKYPVFSQVPKFSRKFHGSIHCFIHHVLHIFQPWWTPCQQWGNQASLHSPLGRVQYVCHPNQF